MKTIKRLNPPPMGWTKIQVGHSDKEVSIRFVEDGNFITLLLDLPIETARELAQAILEEIKL